MKTKNILFAIVATASILVYSCTKDSGKDTTFQILMTDAPTTLQEVNIDLREVRVKFTDTAWVTLQTNAGVYNLLALQNGVSTLIAQGNFASNVVKEIRLILGENNTVKEDNQVYPLRIPSGAESGLKIKVDKKLNATLETLLIDFDAALSVKKENDGYKLRPVIKVKG
ncbi:MAG: DUF4382 domain-containing protein [Chitinophagaceae bacterium]